MPAQCRPTPGPASWRAPAARRAFAAGWLMLGGLGPLAAALVQALVQRLETVFERLFGIEVITPWLVVAVVPLVGLQALLASSARWPARTALVWGGAAVLAGLIAWAFSHQPPSRGALPERQPLDHWLSSVALLAAGTKQPLIGWSGWRCIASDRACSTVATRT